MGGLEASSGLAFEEQTVLASDFPQTESIVNNTITDIVKPVTPNFSHTITESDLKMVNGLIGLNVDSWNFVLCHETTKTATTALSDNFEIEVELNSVSIEAETETVADGKRVIGYTEIGLVECAVGDVIDLYLWSTAGASIFQHNATKIFFIPKQMTVTANMISFLKPEDEQVSNTFSDVDDFTMNSSATQSHRDWDYNVNSDNASGWIGAHGLVVMKGQILISDKWNTATGGFSFDTTGTDNYTPNIEHLKHIRALI